MSTIKSLVVSLGCILSSQDDDAWSYESTRNIYRLLLTFLVHEKPCLKKAAHEAIIKVFTNSQNRSHPAAHQTVEYIVKQINNELNSLSSLLTVKDRDCKGLLRLINILVSIIPYLSALDLKQSVEGLLKISKFNNYKVVQNIFNQFCILFTKNLSGNQLSFEISAKLITALHHSRPKFNPNMYQNFFDCYQHWLKSIIFGCQHLVKIIQNTERIDLSASHSFEWEVIAGQYEKLIKVIYEAFIETSSEDLAAFNAALIDSVFVNLQFDLTSERIKSFENTLFPGLCKSLSAHLDIGHRHLWIHILDITARLIRVWSSIYDSVREPLNEDLIQFLTNLAILRDGLVDGNCPLISDEDDQEFTRNLTDSIDRVFIVSLESLGPEVVLQRIVNFDNLIDDLESCKKLNFVRSWLPPLFNHFRPLVGCNLTFFRDEILPKIERICNFACKLASTSDRPKTQVDPVQLVTLSLSLAKQLWSLLPAMLSGENPPQDWTSVSEGGLGKLLIQHLMKTSPFRGVILRSLKNLINHSTNSEEGKRVLRSGAKMMLQSLLTLYEENNVTICSDIQNRIRQTLIPYVKIIPADYLDGPCKLCLTKFLGDNEKLIFLEILQILIPHCSQAMMTEVFMNLQPLLKTHDYGVLKKVYRIVEELFRCTSENALNFIHENDWHGIFFRESECYFNAVTTVLSERGKLEVNTLKTPPTVRTPIFGIVRVAHLPWKSRLQILKTLFSFEMLNCTGKLNEMTNLISPYSKIFLDEVILSFSMSKNKVSKETAIDLLIWMAYVIANRVPPTWNKEYSGEVRGLFLNRFDSSVIWTNGQSTGDELMSRQDSDKDMIDNRSIISQGEARYSFFDDAVMVKYFVDWIDKQFLSTRIQVSSEKSLISVLTLASISCLIEIFLHQPLVILLTNFTKKMSSNSAPLQDEFPQIHANYHLLQSLITDMAKLSTKLTSSKTTNVIVLGLRLISVLIPLSLKTLNITEVLAPINSIQINMQFSVKKYTKRVLTKIIRKYGGTYVRMNICQALKKMTVNIDKAILKETQKDKSKLSKDSGSVKQDEDYDDVLSTRTSVISDVKSVISAGTNFTRRSALSMPRKVHIDRFDELLRDGHDPIDARGKLNQLKRDKNDNPVDSHSTRSKHKNLADELANLEIEHGLSRKSKRRLQQASDDDLEDDDGSNSDDEDDDSNASMNVDEDTNDESGRKRKNFYLYENAISSEVLDLADTDSLATSGIMGRNIRDVKRTLASKHRFTTDELADLVESVPDPVAMAKKRKLDIKSTSRMINKKLLLDPNVKTHSVGSDIDSDISVQDIPSDDEESLAGEKKHHSFKQQQQRGGIRRFEKKSSSKPGAEYSSSKAGGDMKRRGKPDPYAYVPLGSMDSTRMLGAKKSTKKLKNTNKVFRKKHKIL